jgi:hypothetical protein
LINHISQTNNSTTFNQKYTGNIKPQEPKSNFKNYTDSFVRNAKESAPMLLGFTSIITILDYGREKMEITKLLKKNLAKYFVPVLIGTSAICSIIENKKSKKV